MIYTDDYKAAATANRRDPKSRLEIQWNSSITTDTLESSSNDENRATQMEQLTNGVFETTQKWAYCSTELGTNELIADGSFHPMPDDLANGEVGWYGANASDINGEWVVDPELLLTYETASLTGSIITIQCDTQFLEYPVDFHLYIYNELTLVHTVNITNNTDTKIIIDLTSVALDETSKIVMQIHKWSAPYGIIKIVEFNINTTQLYYNDKTVKISILEESEYNTGTIPIGNISSNQIDIELINYQDVFSAGNTNSPIHNLLLKDRQVKVWLGFVLSSGSLDASSGNYIVENINGKKVGFVPMGTFWSDDWITNRNGYSVKTYCRDIFDKFRQTEFSDSLIYPNITLYDLAEIVLTSAKNKFILNNDNVFEWEIADTLKDIVIPIGFFEKMSYFEAIKQITEVGQTTAFADRNNKVIVGLDLA